MQSFRFQYGQITPQLAFKVLLQFDKCINNALNQKVKARVTFKANKLNTYRFCDNVWTLMLNDVEFREVHEFEKVDKIKIVACDGKSSEPWKLAYNGYYTSSFNISLDLTLRT